LVVLDAGSRLDAVCACCEASAPAYAGATRLLVVTDTEPIALAASYALVKAARERTAAFPGGPVSADVVVNRHDEAAARHACAQIAQACREFLAVTPHLVGSLPDDGSLARALRAGMPLQDAAAGSPAAAAAQSLAERLLADIAGGRAADRSGSPGDRTARRPLPPSYAPPFRSSAVPTGALR
jgi:MinD-like ATPase involved in chromosome partitioning or flagellar assembly